MALVAAIQALSLPVLERMTPQPEIAWLMVLACTAAGLALVVQPSNSLLKFMKKPWGSVALGLGWTGLASWFSPEYAALCGMTLVLVGMSLRMCGVGWPVVTTWFICIFSGLWMWESAVEAQSMTIWGLQVFALVVLMSNPRISDWLVIVISILLGALAGAVGVFFWIPLLVAASMLAVWPGRAVTVAAVGGIICYFTRDYMGTPLPEWPFSEPEVLWPAATLVIIVMILMVYNWRWWSPVWQLAWGIGVVAMVFDTANAVELSEMTGLWQAAVPAVAFALLGRLGHENRIKHL